ncbi:hypothetical protein B1M_33247, partial [Burkholderia sp. TJI49]
AKATGRIPATADATQGAGHGTDGPRCCIGNRADDSTETASGISGAAEPTQGASHRADHTAKATGRIAVAAQSARHCADHAAKTTSRIAIATERPRHRTDHAVQATGRIPATADTTQGACHGTDCTGCCIGNRADDSTETASRITAAAQCACHGANHAAQTAGRIAAATDTTQCAGYGTERAGCRVGYRPDDSAKAAGRVAVTAQCPGDRANHPAETASRITVATEATQRTSHGADHTAEPPRRI